MDEQQLHRLLSSIGLESVRYAASVGSTNAWAGEWLAAGAPDLALVAAGEQTAGRGQAGRSWQSPADSSLAFSLILRENLQANSALLTRLTALGTLGVCEALTGLGLTAEIKWPNDVLVNKRKVAGVLTEASWSGSSLEGVILGIGVNVKQAAVTQAADREGELRYPSTSVEDAAGRSIDRWHLLVEILRGLLSWRDRLNRPEFVQAWEAALAFRNETIHLLDQRANTHTTIFEGTVLGLAEDGALRIKTPTGEMLTFHAGEIRLRPSTAQAVLGNAKED